MPGHATASERPPQHPRHCGNVVMPGRCLDLDGHDSPIGCFRHHVDLGTVSVAQVMEAHLVVDQSHMPEQLVHHEGLVRSLRRRTTRHNVETLVSKASAQWELEQKLMPEWARSEVSKRCSLGAALDDGSQRTAQAQALAVIALRSVGHRI